MKKNKSIRRRNKRYSKRKTYRKKRNNKVKRTKKKQQGGDMRPGHKCEYTGCTNRFYGPNWGRATEGWWKYKEITWGGPTSELMKDQEYGSNVSPYLCPEHHPSGEIAKKIKRMGGDVDPTYLREGKGTWALRDSPHLKKPEILQ